MNASAKDLLNRHGIKLASYAAGQHASTCPECSPKRSRVHQKTKCLGVKIEGGRVCWNCAHCGWSSPEKGSGGKRRGELPSYVYHDKGGVERFRKVRNQPAREPRFWIQHPDGKGGWAKGSGEADTSILYHADAVALAIAEGRTVLVVEGEKDADNMAALGFVATCNAHGASEPGKKPKWTIKHSEQLRGADLMVFNDHDPAGYEHADTTCKLSLGIAKRVRRLDLVPHWPDIPKGGDVSDWLAAGHNGDELRALIESAPDYESKEQPQEQAKPESPANGEITDAEIARLAKLTTMQYEQERKSAADKLKVRAPILDKLVATERVRLGLGGSNDPGQGNKIEFPEPEPWPQPVRGDELLSAVAGVIRSHVVMPDRERDICALWVVYTYLVNCFLVSPRLAIRSPAPECGKTTLLDVLQHLVFKPLRTSSVTASVTFRVIAQCQPTLLIDEAKNIADKTDLLEVLNDGHRRGGQTLRSVPVGDGYEARGFATFSALAIALIGSLPPELHGRSVVIDLKRRMPGDEIKEMRVGRSDHLDVLARRAVRWAADNVTRFADIDPSLPPGIFNREADNWRPLLAIADVAGGEWPQRARDAAVKSHAAADVGDASTMEMLLADIRDVFAEKTDVEISSADLVKVLIDLEGRPWAELGKGRKPLTTNGLARRLKPLKIAPGHIDPQTRIRGYKLTQFEEAFSRYLPPEGDSNRSTVRNAANTGTSDDFQPFSPNPVRTVAKCEKPNNDGLPNGRTVAKGENGDARVVCAYCGRPGGNEVAFGDDDASNLRLHRECENPWIERRMAEEGLRRA